MSSPRVLPSFDELRAAAARRNFASELWIGMPKDKTLSGKNKPADPTADFLSKAGFGITDRFESVDDFRLTNPNGEQANIRVFITRPESALEYIAKGTMDCAIVGREMLKNFNKSARAGLGPREKVRDPIVEIVDLDIAPCALAISARLDDPNSPKTLQDLNGRVIGTKYKPLVENWAKAKGITFEDIVVVKSNLEIAHLFDQRISVYADMAESGVSVRNTLLRPVGLPEDVWAPIRDGQMRLSDMTREQMGKYFCFLTQSRAVFVRTSRTLSDAKEDMFDGLKGCFADAATQNGRTPLIRTERQTGRFRAPPKRVAYSGRAVGHGEAWGDLHSTPVNLPRLAAPSVK